MAIDQPVVISGRRIIDAFGFIGELAIRKRGHAGLALAGKAERLDKTECAGGASIVSFALLGVRVRGSAVEAKSPGETGPTDDRSRNHADFGPIAAAVCAFEATDFRGSRVPASCRDDKEL
jgi:hypothetical protein